MLETGYTKKKELYDKHLYEIDNIKFTFREIDVIACIIHNRGKKKVASLLSVSPRTVSTHVHNIMLKLGHSSRENIIDFIERSGKLLFIRKYYLHLLIQASFEKYLIKIGKTINRQGIDYTIVYTGISADEKLIFNQLQDHLKLANINLSTVEKKFERPRYKLRVLNSNSVQQKQLEDIFLLFDPNMDIDKYSNIDYIDFRKQSQYYFSAFELLRKFMHNSSVDQLIKEFRKDYDAIQNSWESGRLEVISPTSSSLPKKKTFNKFIIFISGTVCFIVFAAWSMNQGFIIWGKKLERNIINSDLPLPQQNILLERPSIIAEIDKRLSKKEGIQTIALVGIGGSGKTTLARKYARKSGISMIWEINAETKDTLISSLKQLSYALCDTSEDYREIDQIQKIQDIKEYERKLFLFLSRKARNHPGWLVIYDNTKAFKDIEKYFPHDTTVWGNGKVIITTNNNNIARSNYILDENVIRVNELSKQEKLKLFGNIIDSNSNISEELKMAYTKCLEDMPPFPLDISIAAHYIRETQIPCDRYLQYMQDRQENFLFAQKNILKDIGEYTKTRHDIITLSIKHIMEASSDFKDLLLFISMIDSQNIPKDLLSAYKNEVTVNSFIHELKKFSLLTKEKTHVGTEPIPIFSIHRSTQDIILAYFINPLQLVKNTDQLQNIVVSLEDYITKELNNDDLKKIHLLLPHVEAFLSCNKLPDELNKANLCNKLGVCYFYVANYAKAQKLLHQTLKIYTKYYGENNIHTAEALARLGGVYRNMGDYDNAKRSLEKALIIYKRYYGAEHAETAKVSIYLGSVYRHIGDYSKSKILSKNGFEIYTKYYDKKDVKTARASAYLGNIYKDIGRYKEAKNLLETALVSYTKYYGKDHTKTAWVSVRLASVYRNIGNSVKAKKLLDYSMKVYQQSHGENCIENAWALGHLGAIYQDLGNTHEAQKTLIQSLKIYNNQIQDDNIIVGWVKYHLGNTYRDLEDYVESQILLQQSLDIHKKYYGENHIKTAQVLNSLGRTYLVEGNIIMAKKYINKALKIFTDEQHPDRYKSLEALADLHMLQAKQEEKIQQQQYHNSEASKYLGQALYIVQKHFPNDSVHAKRIQLNINYLNPIQTNS